MIAHARTRAGEEPEACAPFRPLSEQLDDIARRVSRLTVSHRDPEAVFLMRSDLAAELRALARRLLVQGRGPS